MAPFLAPATARVERRLDRANILGKLLLSFVDGVRRWSGVRFGSQCLEVEGLMLLEAVVWVSFQQLPAQKLVSRSHPM